MQINIFTDGSCTNNGSEKAKAGIGVYFPENEYENISEPFTNNPTNQRAELYAILKALTIIDIKKYEKINIYTDSMYSINSLTKWITKWIKTNFKNIKNTDIIIPIYDILKTTNKINFIHVRSHMKNDNIISVRNNIVDKLAKNGIKTD